LDEAEKFHHNLLHFAFQLVFVGQVNTSPENKATGEFDDNRALCEMTGIRHLPMLSEKAIDSLRLFSPANSEG